MDQTPPSRPAGSPSRVEDEPEHGPQPAQKQPQPSQRSDPGGAGRVGEADTDAGPLSVREREPDLEAAARSLMETGASITQTSAEVASQRPARPDDTAPGYRVPVPLAVQAWERYQLLECLGVGGMGVVYKARDPRLNRFVAIKFLRGHKLPPMVVERFYREARAQARVEHDHVCKIYEVGEAHGLPYIAMQFITGESLRATGCRDISLEQRVELMRQVALGLHAAHRQGLIHRDVKPANVMVERAADGALRAYVMDFGIAWENTDGPVPDGRIEGTPAYMSPEQALGEARHLDRRSDVYSLGATCYELLTQRTPFIADSTGAMLEAVKSALPTPIRQINPRVPLDLEMIVMKCLEKSPDARYGSAQAVADELTRLLNGEPVLVRQRSFFYRVTKRAKKNKLLVAVVAASLLAVLVASGMGIRAQLQARRAAEIGRQLAQKAERIETLMRFAYALPLHDIAREEDLVRLEMAALTQSQAQYGPLGQGPTLYALGRGYLVMHDFKRAHESLELALRRGYQTPEAHYALGLALGELYQQGLPDARKIANKELRARQLAALDTSYRQPALAHLRKTDGLRTEAAEYAQGLVAFYSEQYDEALRMARMAEARAPWMYEAKQLQADAYTALGTAKRFAGQYAEAVQDFQQAALLIHGASDIARSDSSVHESEARILSILAEVSYLQGKADSDMLDQALAASDRAIASNPRFGKAYERKAHILLRRVREQFRAGADLLALARLGLELAQRAASLSPHDSYPLAIQANIFTIQAEDNVRRGQDALPLFAKAIEILQKIIEVDPRWEQPYNMLADTLCELGMAEADRGLDPRPRFEAAVRAAREGIRVNPDFNLTHVELLLAYARLALYECEHGGRPDAVVQQALEHAARHRAMLGSVYGTHQALAMAHLAQARAVKSAGRDPGPHIQAGIDEVTQALTLNDQEAELFALAAELYAIQAEQLQDVPAGRQAEAIDKGLAAVERALALNPRLRPPAALRAHLLQLRVPRLLRPH